MELETARLLLREYEEADWTAVLAYNRDPRYQPDFPGEPWTDTDAREFVRQFLQDTLQVPRTRFQFAIVFKEDGRLIGSCGLRLRRLVSFGESQVDEADIGYEIDPAHRGLGLAREAAAALSAFGFRDLHLHRIWAYCWPRTWPLYASWKHSE